MVLCLILRRLLNPESEKLLIGATPSVRSLVLLGSGLLGLVGLRRFRKT
jgi:hypothetical protein